MQGVEAILGQDFRGLAHVALARGLHSECAGGIPSVRPSPAPLFGTGPLPGRTACLRGSAAGAAAPSGLEERCAALSGPVMPEELTDLVAMVSMLCFDYTSTYSL